MLHLPELPRVGQQVLNQLKSRSTSDIIQAPPSSGTRENHHLDPAPSSPSPLPFSRSLRRGSDPPQHRTAPHRTAPPRAHRVPVRQARSEDAPLPRAPPEWPPPAADREREARAARADPDPAGRRGRDRPHRHGGRGVRALPSGHQGPRPRLARLPRRRLRAPGRALLHQAPRQGGK